MFFFLVFSNILCLPSQFCFHSLLIHFRERNPMLMCRMRVLEPETFEGVLDFALV